MAQEKKQQKDVQDQNLLAQRKQKAKRRNRIILIAVLVCVGVVVIYVGMKVKKAAADLTAALAAAQQTDTVTVRDLKKSIGATGTVIAVDTKDVTSELQGVKLSEVRVKVGDVVTAGDILAGFETTDIEKSLAEAQSALETAEKMNDLSAASASASVSNTKRNNAESLEDADGAVKRAYENFKKANDTYETLKKDYDSKKSATDGAYQRMTAAQSAMEEAKKAAGSESVSGNDALTASAAYQTAYTAYQEALTAYESAKAVSDVAADKANAQAESAQELYKSYESAQTAYERTVAATSSSLASARNAYESATLGLSADAQEKQVENYEKQLVQTTVTSPISGIVTAVNYEAGDAYTGGAIVTVRDISSFEIRTYISEYDISDVAVGQKVLIKTNATGNEELQGTVIFVSPTASATASSSNDVSYEVRLSLDTPNDRLRLDMSASLSIITLEHDGALTVPYNAVQTDEEGNPFVEVAAEEGTTRILPVTVLMESSYYTEISGEGISEGVTVVVPETTDTTSILDELYF